MMKKIFIVLFLILITANIQSSKPVLMLASADMPIHKDLRPYMRELIKIVDKHKLNVDWTRVEAVDLAPLRLGIQGSWFPTSHVVMINYYLQFPEGIRMTRQEKDDFILLVLAHEVGHSQGLTHTPKENMSLMNPSSRFDLSAIRGMGAEQYIVNTYKARL